MSIVLLFMYHGCNQIILMQDKICLEIIPTTIIMKCDSFGEELNQFYCIKKAYANGIQIEN